MQFSPKQAAARENKKKTSFSFCSPLALHIWLTPKVGCGSGKQKENFFFLLFSSRLALLLSPERSTRTKIALQMINFKMVCKALGSLLFIEALLLILCLGIGFLYGETDYATFGLPTAVALVLGILLKLKGRGADNRMGRRDGFLIVSAAWIVFSLVGMLPFLVGGHTPRVAVAMFETMSGFTTTGATAFDDVDALPHSILFWRSLTHWMGGLGIVFFTIALLPNMGQGDLRLFSAESTGLKIGKLHPRISTTARWLWGLYLLLTAACLGAYHLAGMNLFDAANHALSTIATGGFSTHTASIGYYESKTIEYVSIGFMFISSINFTLLYLLLIKRKWRSVWADSELRCFLLILGSVSLIMAVTLCFDGLSVEESVRTALFNVVSLQSTTGFTATDFMMWHPALWMLLSIVSVIGACAGSTSGGLKCVRVLTAMKLVVNEFRQKLHPHAVLPVRIGGNTLAAGVARTVFVFFAVYFLLIFVSAILMSCMGLPLLDALGLGISAFSNVGPSIGYVVGPLDSWGTLPDAALYLNAFLMLAGRLEIFSLLLLFVPAFWRNN